ncbi:MAG: DsbA family protein [Crenarchaeota archaeon]|nr:DsbA family protein [Thermoproteota archaeon]MDA1124137.1 DsbA family protein [Thermoproteota archaeon]
MVDMKKIAVAGAAVVLVTILSIFATSYMSDFDTARTSTTEDELKKFELKQAPVLGSQTATVTIIEIGDYQCHMCKLWFEETRPQIIENYINTGKVNLVFVDMPFLGSDSAPASEATYCADDQGKYWDYHSMLYRYQEEIDDGWANANRLQAFAFNLDLDIEQFDKCMTADDHYKRVNYNKKVAATEFQANSTPTFVIVNTLSGDAKRIAGAHPYSTFEDIINSLL